MIEEEEEPLNNERWLISYADFITLLFAFFVVMYAISSVNEGKYKAMVKSLNSAFQSSDVAGGEVIQAGRGELPIGTINVNKDQESQKKDIPLKIMSEAIRREFEGFIADGSLSVRQDQDWMEIQLQGDLLFEVGGAYLKARAKEILFDLAQSLNKFYNPITVEGFTDNEPISNGLYPSNWELSADRAVSVVRELISSGVAKDRMAAVGYGENYPIATNKTEAGKRDNRRVVILVEKNNQRRVSLEDSMSDEGYLLNNDLNGLDSL